MCLDSLADFEVPDPGVGWKVFLFMEPPLLPHAYGWWITKEYPVFFEWLKEGDYRKIIKVELFTTDCGSKYPMGFHVFLTKKDAEEWKYNDNALVFILPVRFRYIVATGYQDYRKVVVAKEMMILAEEL